MQEVVNLHASLLQEHARAFLMIKNRVDALLSESVAVACDDASENCRMGCGVSVIQHFSQNQQFEFPWITIFVVFFGCLSIFTFAFKEWTYFNREKANDIVDPAHYWKSLAAFFQYRLDFYLSVSTASKPLFLLTLSFIIILLSALALMMFTGEDFSSSFWIAWTYVADSGKFRKLLHLKLSSIC